MPSELKRQCNARLADRRVNTINLRREFFRATPAQVKVHLAELAGELLDYRDEAEAVEYRQCIQRLTNAALSTQ